MSQTHELTIMPCRDDESGKWFCEVVVAESGKTLFCSDARQSRGAAINRAQAQIAELKKLMEAGR